MLKQMKNQKMTTYISSEKRNKFLFDLKIKLVLKIFLNFNNIEMEQKMDQGMEPKVEQQSETQTPTITEQPVKKTRGRKPKYHTPEEKAEAQRIQSLKYYYRQKAKLEMLKEKATPINPAETAVVEVKVSSISPKLGKIEEVVRYKVLINGELVKIQE